jgi:hypothetical protein
MTLTARICIEPVARLEAGSGRIFSGHGRRSGEAT